MQYELTDPSVFVQGQGRPMPAGVPVLLHHGEAIFPSSYSDPRILLRAGDRIKFGGNEQGNVVVVKRDQNSGMKSRTTTEVASRFEYEFCWQDPTVMPSQQGVLPASLNATLQHSSWVDGQVSLPWSWP